MCAVTALRLLTHNVERGRNMNRIVQNGLRTKERIRYAVKRYQGITIETDLTDYLHIVEEITQYDCDQLTDTELLSRAERLRAGLRSGRPAGGLLPETYALVCEAARRELGIDPFAEQLVAAVVLQRRKLAQMRTGEGKTLAAVFPACVEGLAGRGVHILTANEYLARRDAEWMGAIYRRLDLQVAHVGEHMSTEEKRSAYRADVTYLTAKQAGFDFLEDEMGYEPESRVQRPFHFCIVDEADFLLIDEARIPLVIARERGQQEAGHQRIDELVRTLEPPEDFTIDRVGRNCFLSRQGERRVRQALHCGGSHEEKSYSVYAAVNVSLLAHHLLTRDVDYVVKEGRIELVDEFTGRVAEKRRWPYGIQGALEAKEGLEVEREGEVCGSITVQGFLKLYPHIAAMTATAVSAADELKLFYGLSTVIIPPHRAEQMEHLPDQVFSTRKAKLDALVTEIETAHSRRRPVLVGTRSVKESEELSAMLRHRGIPHRVLNAKNDAAEARLIARAGTPGAVTVSTNMAGRGTDIRLGGGDELERARIVALGGLLVLGTARHESVRVDNQLRGRAGRQGDPGTSRFFVSLEDDLITRYAITEFIPGSYLTSESSQPIADPSVAKEITRAQSIIERQHFEMRRTLRRYTELIERQRQDLSRLRWEAISDHSFPETLLDACDEPIALAVELHGDELASRALAAVFARCLDDEWTRHLAWVDDVREGIHLRRLGKQDPLLAFIRDASHAFRERIDAALAETADRFAALDPRRDFEALMQELRAPSSTWTYLINDNPFPSFRVGLLGLDIARGGAVGLGLMAAAPFLLLVGLIKPVVRRLRRAGFRGGTRG